MGKHDVTNHALALVGAALFTGWTWFGVFVL